MNGVRTKVGLTARGLALGLLLLFGANLRAEIPVLRAGRALLPVIVADTAAPEEKAAAQELARVLGLMAGSTWPVVSAAADEPGFRVGGTAGAGGESPLIPATDLLSPTANQVNPDAFRIRTHAGSVFVEAATPAGTGYAVAWLLQYAAGVRWYAPGEAGEVIPRRTDWSVPDLNVTIQPAYVSREIQQSGGVAGQTWALRNGLRGRLEYSHALNHVFDPELLARRPDWWSLVRGKRSAPVGQADHHWQPHLALPEVAEYAAVQAAAAFAQDPARASFSLGINDSLRFDQSPATQALIAPLRYFRGMPDHSALVFSFMNRAAERLAQSHPDRYLGGLAYFWCEDTPPFPVHPQVLPYVTTDRSQYYDPAYRDADFALMSRWQNSGARAFGLWEYAYGQGFLIPRSPQTALAAGIREGWHRGARGYFAELGAHAGFDVFKNWMIARLLWEPERPWTELADDFFPGYYGQAAVSMRAFFERCEAQWMTQSGPPYWLKFYRQEDQALLFPAETCRELRGLLDVARVQADTPVVAARVRQTATAFAVTERYGAFDSVRRELAGRAVPGSDLAEQARRLVQREEDFRSALDAAGAGESPAMAWTNPAPFVANDPLPRLLLLRGQVDPHAPLRLLAEAGQTVSAVERWWRLAGLIASGRLASAPDLVTNGSFRDVAVEGQRPRYLFPHSGDFPAGWEWQAVPTEHGSVRLLDGPGDAPHRILRVEGAWDTQIFQWVRAVPETVYLATIQLRGNSSPGGDASLYLTFLSAEGEVRGTHRMQSLPKGGTADWRVMALADVAPAGTAWVGVGFGASRQVAGDWLEAKAVRLQGVKGEESPP